jgi:ABC-2 type transport system permease protein
MRDQRTSMWIYAGVMFIYGMLITMAFLSISDMFTDPLSEQNGLVLTEVAKDEQDISIFNLTWASQVGVASHIAIGMETNGSLMDLDLDIENLTGLDPEMIIDTMGRPGSEERPVIPMKLPIDGIELIYFGGSDWVTFLNNGSSKFFMVGLIPNDWNMSNATFLGPVSSTELVIGSEIDKIMEDNPMVKILMGDEKVSFTEIDGFLAIEYFSMWPLMLLIFLAIKTGGTVSKHVDDQSIDILLATGYSRFRFLNEKLLVVLVNMVLVVFGAWLGLILGTLVIGEPVPFVGMTMTFIGSVPMAIGMIGIALMISVIVDESSKTTGAIMGVTIFMFMIQIVSNIAGWQDGLGYISLFRYFNMNELMVGQVFDPVNVIVPMAVGTVTIIGAYILFWKKDIHA